MPTKSERQLYVNCYVHPNKTALQTGLSIYQTTIKKLYLLVLGWSEVVVLSSLASALRHLKQDVNFSILEPVLKQL